LLSLLLAAGSDGLALHIAAAAGVTAAAAAAAACVSSHESFDAAGFSTEPPEQPVQPRGPCVTWRPAFWIRGVERHQLSRFPLTSQHLVQFEKAIKNNCLKS
jgi:hypothetical protein